MRATSVISFAFVFAVSAVAAAQSPELIPVQGHLADAEGVPIDGTRDLSFVLYDDASGGQVVHTETFTAHPIADGDFVVYLGDNEPLSLETFRDEDRLWLEISVGTEVIEPRLQLATAPYAGYASYCGDADTLAGFGPTDFAATTHGHTWSDVTGVPSDLADGDDDSLATLGVTCAPGNVAQWTGTMWTCAPVGFDNIAWPTGFSYLTVDPCPAGFTAFESGYVKLSSTPSLAATSRTLATPGHFHSRGDLTVQSDGNHTHNYLDYFWQDTAATDPNFGVPSGDGTGNRYQVSRTTAASGTHTHPLAGGVGAVTSGVDGDADMEVTGELEHVALRLCVKD